MTDKLPYGVIKRQDGKYVLKPSYSYQSLLMAARIGDWHFTKPYEDYTELLSRIGLDCKVNIIMFSTKLSHTNYSENDYVLDKIDIYRNGSLIYTVNDGITVIKRASSFGLRQLVYNYMVNIGILNTVINEYIEFMKEPYMNAEAGKPEKRMIFVEYSKECLKNFKELKLYNNLKEVLTNWRFDQESNYLEEALLKVSRKTLNDFINSDYDLYDKIHNISLLKYEGGENRGKILFCGPPSLIGDFVHFKEGIQLRDSRRLRTIRKLLEICIGDIYLLANEECIYGFGKVVNEIPANSFFIKFKGQGSWELANGNLNTVMHVSYGLPSLSKLDSDKENFLQKSGEIFESKGNYDKVWDFIDKAKRQRHGTMVVITDKAEKESERLNKNSFTIVPNEMNDLELVYGLTSIDGAVMLDHFGKCYSIGCILDGTTESNVGDSSRGARFNSALRYIHYCMNKQYKILIVVVSEDGMTNVLTKDDILTS
ncbi:DNA integrity scanning protein DisA nucleotide-binding domain protein [Priestia aryabhattai]|uniref:DNA integrity scanning protein DisA nucleotide-binding domain protein n=1 Tax=Priestia aryabhattai TaxID=412384 RepID=UPI001FB26BF6|nr:diadenylate cyclase [Priestia aryabhattai]